MKTIYLWISDKGWTPFQYNELSELASEFEARNIKLGNRCKLGNRIAIYQRISSYGILLG